MQPGLRQLYFFEKKYHKAAHMKNNHGAKTHPFNENTEVYTNVFGESVK